ncbi:MAG: hypothetical protein EO766_17665 [Hydrotalea sp. AMD]|uniref:hypothetical protein n=1 Tax=Hydrotalea sp. AMD TaxID=2501297 RepID=UPI0010286976|nr:hypothetical protein [Hydrotalea sp. AMD]RWZ83497.1 MAG: hypothetical protein EO766_17665 [Hydrotalea sp. AMD]
MAKIVIPAEDISEHMNDSGILGSFNYDSSNGMTINYCRQAHALTDVEFEVHTNLDLELECPDYIEKEKFDKQEHLLFVTQAELKGAQHRILQQAQLINDLQQEFVKKDERLKEQANTILKYANAKLAKPTTPTNFWSKMREWI